MHGYVGLVAMLLACGHSPNSGLQDASDPTDSGSGSADASVPSADVVGATLAAGSRSICSIHPDSTLWCWGANHNGEIDASKQDRPREVQIGTATDWRTTVRGDTHGCGLRADGSLWCWGQNSFGEVGDGTTTPRTEPVQIGSDHDWHAIYSSGVTCAIKTNHSLWCWGDQFGLVPKQIGTNVWKTVSPSFEHYCGIADDDTLWCWGSDVAGAVGDGDPSGLGVVVPDPVPIGTAHWTSIASGRDAACGTQPDGSLWCWGFIYIGASAVAAANAPILIDSTVAWSDVRARGNQVCGKHDSAWYCAGWNRTGQLGDGSHVDRASFVAAPGDFGELAMADDSTCGRDASGAISCWGYNADGELGTGRTSASSEPTKASVTTASTSIAGTTGSRCSIDAMHHAVCWGPGPLGFATDRPEQLPIALSGTWTKLAGGSGHFCGIGTDGSLWCWGDNTLGQLGIGTTTTNVSTPTRVGTGMTWIDVAGGGSHTCGVQSDGSLWCWGDGNHSQLGNGMTSALTPQHIGTTTWRTVSAGFDHTCAIASDGTAYCWGNNQEHEAGLGVFSANFIPTPTQVDSLQWLTIAAGNTSTCGLLTDHTVACWGHEFFETDHPEPSEIAGTWSSIANTFTGRCGVQTDGTLWCFNFVANQSPQQIGTATTWTTLAPSQYDSCAGQTDGTVWCWGRNVAGEHGNGETWKETPQPIVP